MTYVYTFVMDTAAITNAEGWPRYSHRVYDYCLLCDKRLDVKGDLSSLDCGGDCLACIDLIEQEFATDA